MYTYNIWVEVLCVCSCSQLRRSLQLNPSRNQRKVYKAHCILNDTRPLLWYCTTCTVYFTLSIIIFNSTCLPAYVNDNVLQHCAERSSGGRLSAQPMVVVSAGGDPDAPTLTMNLFPSLDEAGPRNEGRRGPIRTTIVQQKKSRNFT